MPKIMFNNSNEVKTNIESQNSLSLTKPSQKINTKMDQMTFERMLRKKRSKKYMEAVKKLDAGGHVHNQSLLDDMINAIREEFPEVDMVSEGVFLGLVDKCYLGVPYEVHTLDCTLNIVEHYKKGEALPNNLEKARQLGISGSYNYIEVYTNCCCAIDFNGNVALFRM